jgi:hypothetical protein
MATQVKVRKCLICGVRPVFERGYCHNCLNSMDAERRRKREARKADKYVTYRGVTIALRQNGDGEYKAEFITTNPDRLPKSKLINLDVYCPGYDREQIKKLKRLCLSFAK